MIYPNLRHLHGFVLTAQLGSFRAAANALGLGEPAISQAIARLEAVLKVRLLDRTTRLVRLTAAGEAMLPLAERLVEDLDRALAAVGGHARDAHETVSILCLSSVAYRMLPPVVVEFQKRHPKIKVMIRDDNARGIERLLQNGNGDFALMSEGADRRAYQFTPLFEDRYCLICPRSDVLARSMKASAKDLEGREVILMHQESAIRRVFDRAMHGRAVRYGVVHQTAQLHTLLGMVEHGLGISVVPGLVCPNPRSATVAQVPFIEPVIKRRIGIVVRRARPPTPAAGAFLKLLSARHNSSTKVLPTLE